MYLISALMIVQRALYFVVACMAAHSLRRAQHDDRVRAEMAGGLPGGAPAEPNGSAKCDVEMGAKAQA